MASGKKTNGKETEPEVTTLRSERRRHLRKQVIVLKIRGEDAAGVFFGYAKTVGPGGMFITSVNPRNVGEEFELSFNITEAAITVRCKAMVAWRREYNPKLKQEPGMGIRFIDLDTKTRDRVMDWVESQQAK
ncbi:MAG: PilZ domain-containing protein [Deltaproteobacteria bacterium]|nr:PilZ domain-containing protein [Deltaproteobacteria bacterium]